MVAAREAAGHPQRPAVYMSAQSHSSVERAARIAGFRRDALRHVECGADYRIRIDALQRSVAADRADGRTPQVLDRDLLA